RQLAGADRVARGDEQVALAAHEEHGLEPGPVVHAQKTERWSVGTAEPVLLEQREEQHVLHRIPSQERAQGLQPFRRDEVDRAHGASPTAALRRTASSRWGIFGAVL